MEVVAFLLLENILKVAFVVVQERALNVKYNCCCEPEAGIIAQKGSRYFASDHA